MADIAAIFHWTAADMDHFSIDELFDWRERAVTIWNRMQGNKDA
ncbi:GpE family phage tail protein [Novosphingobium sp. 9]|nr:GpE family phage tail protein [Novosphingobium sp. 9]